MPHSTSTRALTDGERIILGRFYESASTSRGRALLAVASTFIQWAATMLAVVVVWLIVAWVMNSLASINIGWRSPVAPWILAVAAAMVAVWAAIYNWNWFARHPSPRLKLSQDLADGQALEEQFVFKSAKCFQEQEHGGLIYFLLDSTDRVYVLYDHESQDLGVQGDEPRSSPLKPMTHLRVVRAPRTRFVLHQQFSGSPLDAGSPLELTIPPEKWPEQDEYTALQW